MDHLWPAGLFKKKKNCYLPTWTKDIFIFAKLSFFLLFTGMQSRTYCFYHIQLFFYCLKKKRHYLVILTYEDKPHIKFSLAFSSCSKSFNRKGIYFIIILHEVELAWLKLTVTLLPHCSYLRVQKLNYSLPYIKITPTSLPTHLALSIEQIRWEWHTEKLVKRGSTVLVMRKAELLWTSGVGERLNKERDRKTGSLMEVLSEELST